MSIIIDKEFQSLIPPLTPEEFQQLEENCVKEGIRDALIVWKQPDGNDILIDGHNRWNISVRHGGIPFQTKQMEFQDRNTAKQWIILNQFGRRNLSAYDRSVLALKLKPIIAEKAKERMVNAPQKKAEREKEINKIWQEHDFDTARVLVAQKKQEFGREDRTEKMAGEKCIYFARFGDNQLKIGSSVYPEDRVKQLSVSCPDIKLVEVIHYGAGAEKHENAIKRKYGKYRIGNECYQCSDGILSEMIAFTKKEAARKNNTDYKLAKTAGVSHDTIHKVETIQNSGDQKLIDDVRSGETTINRAYQVVKGIDPIKTKSPAQMNKERIEKAQEEHEQFQQQKVVDFSDIAKDKENRRTLAKEMYRKLISLGSKIEEVSIQNEAGDIDLIAIGKELTHEEKKMLLDMIGIWRQQLTKIGQEVTSN